MWPYCVAVEIHPRYDGDPVIVVDGAIDDIRVPFLRQRRRLLAEMHELAEAEWAAPSRCEGWSSKDVISHLASTDRFWSVSLARGIAGDPTRFLVGFDPKATPAALAAAESSVEVNEMLDGFAAGVEALCDAVEALTDDQWDLTAEAPPGHLAVRAVVHHALWDSWVHERDVLLPLGRRVIEEPDEIVASLRYASALSPSFAVGSDPTRRGTLVLDVTEPDRRLVADIGSSITVGTGGAPDDALVIEGRAVDVLETLSVRRPFDQELPADTRWMVAGLAEIFETETS